MNNIDKLLELEPEKLQKLLALVDKLDNVSTDKPINDTPQKTGRKKKHKQNVERKDTRRGQGKPGKGKKFTSREQVKLDGTNHFIGSEFENMHRRDVETDRKLAGQNTLEPRNAKRTVTIECEDCEYEFEVPPDNVIQDDEGARYVCDECAKKRR